MQNVFTGLRRGEKLHEVRLGDEEPDHRPFHPLMSHVAVPPLEPSQVFPSHDDEELRYKLRAICLKYSPAMARASRALLSDPSETTVSTSSRQRNLAKLPKAAVFNAFRENGVR